MPLLYQYVHFHAADYQDSVQIELGSMLPPRLIDQGPRVIQFKHVHRVDAAPLKGFQMTLNDDPCRH